MDKNEILARSREENKKQDERDRMIADKAAKLGYSTGLIVCMVLVIVETAITGNANLKTDKDNYYRKGTYRGIRSTDVWLWGVRMRV